MVRKIKATLFLSQDKREKIRRSGLSLEEYFNRIYDMSERFTMDRWIDGCFWIEYFRVGLVQSGTLNLIIDHFNEEELLRIGREVGENVQNNIKYAFYLEPENDVSQKKMIEYLNSLAGWGKFTLEDETIIVKNPIFNNPFFLRGYLEGFLNLKLRLIESQPDLMTFNVQEPRTEVSWMEGHQEFDEKFRKFAEKGFDLIYTLDRNRCITYVSPSTERILNCHPTEIVGKHLEDCLQVSEVPKAVRAFDRCLNSYNIEVIKLNMLRKDRSTASIKAYMFPIILNGKVAGVQGIAKDMKRVGGGTSLTSNTSNQ